MFIVFSRLELIADIHIDGYREITPFEFQICIWI